jgi:hypothetical protein
MADPTYTKVKEGLRKKFQGTPIFKYTVFQSFNGKLKEEVS